MRIESLEEWLESEVKNLYGGITKMERLMQTLKQRAELEDLIRRGKEAEKDLVKWDKKYKELIEIEHERLNKEKI